MLQKVGLGAAVPNAASDIVGAADWVSSVPGGSGAVREFAEELLKARGEWRGLVDAYVDECLRRWRGGADA